MKAVILVEAIQGILIVSLCACLAWFTFQTVGGFHETLARIDSARLKLVMDSSDPYMPWIGLVTGVPIIGFYYWCTNQSMVQRVLGAKSVDHGRWGSLLGGALKLTNLFLVILPGAACVILYPHLDAPDQAFSRLVFDVLPHGLIGLILAFCLISILSSLASAYNSTATLLTMDFIRPLRPGMSDRDLVTTGRIVTVFLVLMSTFWAPQISHVKDTLWQYLQAVMSYFVPPVAAVFLAGFFSRRVNSAGAAWGLATGTTASFAGFFLIEVFDVVPLHFLVASAVIFAVSLGATFAGSLFTAPEDPQRIVPLMFSRAVWREETAALAQAPFYRNYRYLSVALIAVTLIIVFIFR